MLTRKQQQHTTGTAKKENCQVQNQHNIALRDNNDHKNSISNGDNNVADNNRKNSSNMTTEPTKHRSSRNGKNSIKTEPTTTVAEYFRWNLRPHTFLYNFKTLDPRPPRLCFVSLASKPKSKTLGVITWDQYRLTRLLMPRPHASG